MAYDFSGFAEGIFGAKKDMEAKKRQASLDALSADERAYERRKALGFEGSSDPAEMAFRKRMQDKADLERRSTEADIGYKNRMPQDRPASGEQAIGAKLTALNAGIADIDARGREAGARWYLPSFMEKEQLTPEESQLREKLRSRRMGLLGVEAPSAAPAGTVTVKDPKTGQTKTVKDGPEVQARIKSGILQLAR